MLDLRTIYINFIMTASISLVFIYLLWYQNRHRYKGLHLLAVDYLLQLSAVLLIALRGLVPDFISIVVANFVTILGAYCGLMGIERFVGQRSKHLMIWIFLPVFLFTLYYFSYHQPNILVRNLSISLGILLISAQSAWILLGRVSGSMRKLTRDTAFVFILFCVVSILRLTAYFFIEETGQEYFGMGTFEAIIALLYQFGLILLSFTLVYMINKRLKSDISQEEHKLSMAYNAVPYAISITRKKDGLLLDINHGFEAVTGYRRENIIGISTLEIGLWTNAYERELLLSMLSKYNEVHDMEFQFSRQSGEIRTGVISCINIQVDNEECLLCVVNDITEKKKAEKELNMSRDILKRLIVNLQTEHENEKINLAAQIDNNLNQSLASLRMNLGLLRKKVKNTDSAISEDIIAAIETTYNQTGVTIERSLNLMNSMRNEVLYLFGFVEAIKFSVEEIESKIECRFSTTHDKIEMDKNRSYALYNIVQEIINHILHKDQASKIHIQLHLNNDMLLVTILENGNSFENYLPPSEESDLLLELKEKVSLFNGLVEMHRTSNDMTSINIEMPL